MPTTKHGLSRHPLYAIWTSMLSRCYNVNNEHYADYGGRGILVCKQWRQSVKTFIIWCLDNGWEKGLYMDRRKNDRGYRPSNVRFVTQKENTRNTRKNVLITLNGVTKNISEWCDTYGIDQKMFHNRRVKLGWPIEKSLKAPIYGKQIPFRSFSLTIGDVSKIKSDYLKGRKYQSDLAKEYNVSQSLISMIINSKRRIKTI